MQPLLIASAMMLLTVPAIAADVNIKLYEALPTGQERNLVPSRFRRLLTDCCSSPILEAFLQVSTAFMCMRKEAAHRLNRMEKLFPRKLPVDITTPRIPNITWGRKARDILVTCLCLKRTHRVM